MLVTVDKNEFFTYFSVKGHDGQVSQAKYRESIQVWNAQGITMRMQGPDWAGGYNGFGKRHLLATAGGKHETGGGFQAKLVLLGGKRSGNPGQKRGKRLTDLATAQLPPKTPGKEGALAFKSDLEKQRTTDGTRYEVNPYGDKLAADAPRSVIVLDGMSRDEAANCFASAILNAGPFVPKVPRRDLVVRFPDACVYLLQTGHHPTAHTGMKIGVCFDGGIYHVYHSDGIAPL